MFAALAVLTCIFQKAGLDFDAASWFMLNSEVSGMDYGVEELARLANVSARTLRY